MSTGKLTLTQIAGTSANFYEHCYVNCQPDSNGFISSLKAAELLKTSGLPDKILSEIWECSDSLSKGYLTKYEFQVALKLVALGQSNFEPKTYNLSIPAPCPRFNVKSPSDSINVWSISIDEQNKFSKVFDGLDSVNGKLSGEAVKPVFINSKLPVTTLGQVWTLSDIDKDGSLDRDEFILAMHLIYKCLAGEESPKSLPGHMIPPSKRRPPSTNSIQSFRTNPSTSSQQSSFLTSSLRLPSSDWVVGKLEKERYDTQFFAADKDKDGLLSGLEIKDTFVQSGLPQNILAKIWDLCDVSKSGMLNSEQFALAMHLINDQISSACTRPIPSSLTAEMMPPSLRTTLASDISTSETLTLHSFGIKAESDDVYKEIENLRRERAQIEQLCRHYEADYISQKQEVKELHETLDRTEMTAQALFKQKEEAQHRLDELIEQKNRSQVMLDDTRHKCKEEREQLETLKRQIGSQSASIEEKRDELKRFQGELNDLIREESSLREQVQKHQYRLNAIEQETSTTESQILVTDKKNKDLENLKSRLQETLEQYEAIVANPGTVDVTKLPDVDIVNKLLATKIVDEDKAKISGWTTDDPFMKDDPFASVADPFGGGSDPFSSAGDPFCSQDPFGSRDPFSTNNGWATNNTKVNSIVTKDQNTAFQIGNVDDLFKNMSTKDTSSHNHFDSNLDPFGFGDSPFDNATEKVAPPPRPTKAPQTNSSTMGKSKAESNSHLHRPMSEINQLSWAKQDSEREAREADAVRKREEADLEKALKLSQAEFRTQERKKASKNKK